MENRQVILSQMIFKQLILCSKFKILGVLVVGFTIYYMYVPIIVLDRYTQAIFIYQNTQKNQLAVNCSFNFLIFDMTLVNGDVVNLRLKGLAAAMSKFPLFNLTQPPVQYMCRSTTLLLTVTIFWQTQQCTPWTLDNQGHTTMPRN